MKWSRSFVEPRTFRQPSLNWWNALDFQMHRHRQSLICVWEHWMVWNVPNLKKNTKNWWSVSVNWRQFLQMKRNYLELSKMKLHWSVTNMAMKEEHRLDLMLMIFPWKIWSLEKILWSQWQNLDISREWLLIISKVRIVVVKVSRECRQSMRITSKNCLWQRHITISCSLQIQDVYIVWKHMRFLRVEERQEEVRSLICCSYSQERRLQQWFHL